MSRQMSEQEAIRGLALAVIRQAVRDLFMGDYSKEFHKARAQISAYEFLNSGEMQFWCDLAGRDFDARRLIENMAASREKATEFYTSRTRQTIQGVNQ